MFGIGLPELIIILIVALIVVGPSRLPELARSMGKAFNEFRRMADDVKDTLQGEMSLEDLEAPLDREKQVVKPAADASATVGGVAGEEAAAIEGEGAGKAEPLPQEPTRSDEASALPEPADSPIDKQDKTLGA